MNNIKTLPLKQAYEIAKVKSQTADKYVVDKYLSQSVSMLSMVINGKATSAPVVQGVVRFIHDVDPSLVPEEYQHLLQDVAMEMVGEDS